MKKPPQHEIERDSRAAWRFSVGLCCYCAVMLVLAVGAAIWLPGLNG